MMTDHEQDNSKMIPEVNGKLVDDQSRCDHYHSPLDIIAIKFACCGKYYACFFCHAELAGHAATAWPTENFGDNAILCGHCKTEMSVHAYKNCGYTCPNCGAAFNPKCANHDHLYFET